MNPADNANEKKVKVKLLKDGHSHAGKPCAKGDTISVTEADAKWLANPKRGLIAPTKAGAAGGEA
ncbi:DUF7210 family protein [Pinirhizobacter sp.]|jgi:hypothetical protein|uniref:DUF7210 family protein n=1 Tax=Pinirhizobacter sp. TaxID=2950432 RepID=UPI002F3E6F9B